MSDTPYVRRNEDGTATLVLPEPCAESYLMSVELLRQFEQTHNDLIAERALADELVHLLPHFHLSEPCKAPPGVTLEDWCSECAAIAAYRKRRPS